MNIPVGSYEFDKTARKYLRQVIKSNRLSYGDFSRRFESEFARIHNCAHAAFMNSGTSALQVILQAMKERYGWKDGDEVIVPAQTFVATANIVLHNRMKPVFVDVDPLTYNLDPDKLEAAITGRTQAVIPVHLMGLPANMREINAIARPHGLKVIEDSCEAMFAKHHGVSVGALGDAAAFSTYVAHYIVTGIGGLATTNDPDLAKRIRSLMNHGRDGIYLSIDDDDGLTGKRLHEVVSKRFHFTSVGHSFRATEFEAALGLAQLESYPKIVKARTSNAARLKASLRDLEDKIQLPTIPQGSDHVFMLFPIVLRDEDKTGLVNHLEDHGIETRDIPALVNQPIYQSLYPDLATRFPVASWITANGFYVGCHQFLKPSDVDRISEVIHSYFQPSRNVPAVIAEETTYLSRDQDIHYSGRV